MSDDSLTDTQRRRLTSIFQLIFSALPTAMAQVPPVVLSSESGAERVSRLPFRVRRNRDVLVYTAANLQLLHGGAVAEEEKRQEDLLTIKRQPSGQHQQGGSCRRSKLS